MAIDYAKLFKEMSVARINSRVVYSTGKLFPSSAGDSCELKLRYGFLGQEQKKTYTHHGKENKIGNAIHDEVQKDFKFKFGDNVEIEKKINVMLEGLEIRGKVDVILGEKLVIELKTIALKDFENEEKFKEKHRKYIKQTQWYLGVLGLRNATIVYLNRDNGIFLASYDLKYDETIYKQIQDKFIRVIKGKNLKPDTRECKYCPYSYVCPSFKPSWTKKE